MKCKKNNIIKKLSAVLTASALLLTGCSGAKSSTQTDQDLTYTDMLFDTVIKIQILDPADESILDGLKKLCEKYDTMFSTTNTDSELYKLNHANGQHGQIMDMDIRIPMCLCNLFIIDFRQPVVRRHRTRVA